MKHFKYGSFISYRNREVNSNYFINLVSFLNAPICEATDLDVFFDRKYVEPSDSIPDRIYEGIAKSMLFIPIFGIMDKINAIYFNQIVICISIFQMFVTKDKTEIGAAEEQPIRDNLLC